MTDTVFCLHPSPVGDILIAATAAGVVTLHPVPGGPDAELQLLERRLGAAPQPDPDGLGAVAGQLDEYFAGRRTTFDIELDWQLTSGFVGAALREICTIPYGQTASYGEVAVLAGSPGAARAVGTACARSPFSIVVPVHRVVRADGSIGPYGNRPEVKRLLLDLEQAAGR